MVQPALDQHFVVMHMGGAKRVARKHDGPAVSTVVENGALTLVPAGTSFDWCTSGPIAFAHLYVRPQNLDCVVTDLFDVDARNVALVDRVGFRDPLLEPLFRRMLEEIEVGARASALLLDCLLENFLTRLARNHISRALGGRRDVSALAPHRLRRVLEYIEANLGRDITLADLVLVAGTSPYHFSHAFHAATACSPYHYVIQRRVEYAKVMLMTSDQPLEAIGTSCGFNSRHQFAVAFKQIVGIGPKRFSLVQRALGTWRRSGEQ